MEEVLLCGLISDILNTMKPRIILGVDPGSRYTGYGILHISGSRLHVEASGRISPKQSLSFAERLAVIFSTLSSIAEQYTPDIMSLEDVHVAHNVRSALKLGQARGVAIAVSALYGMTVFDCTPTLVKKTMTSYGGASKEQVAFMVERYLGKKVESSDESDAIAIALCAYHYAPEFQKHSIYK